MCGSTSCGAGYFCYHDKTSGTSSGPLCHKEAQGSNNHGLCRGASKSSNACESVASIKDCPLTKDEDGNHCVVKENVLTDYGVCKGPNETERDPKCESVKTASACVSPCVLRQNVNHKVCRGVNGSSVVCEKVVAATDCLKTFDEKGTKCVLVNHTSGNNDSTTHGSHKITVESCLTRAGTFSIQGSSGVLNAVRCKFKQGQELYLQARKLLLAHVQNYEIHGNSHGGNNHSQNNEMYHGDMTSAGGMVDGKGVVQNKSARNVTISSFNDMGWTSGAQYRFASDLSETDLQVKLDDLSKLSSVAPRATGVSVSKVDCTNEKECLSRGTAVYTEVATGTNSTSTVTSSTCTCECLPAYGGDRCEIDLTWKSPAWNWNKVDVNAGKDQPAFPYASVSWAGNFEVECNGKKLSAKASQDMPVDYLFVVPPKADAMTELFSAFGAKAPATPSEKGVINFAFMTTAAKNGQSVKTTFTQEEWSKCVADGTAKFRFADVPMRGGNTGSGMHNTNHNNNHNNTNSPPQMKPHFRRLGEGMTSAANGSSNHTPDKYDGTNNQQRRPESPNEKVRYRMVDSQGNDLIGHPPVVITKETVTCDAKDAQAIDLQYDILYKSLMYATTKEENAAAEAGLNILANSKNFVGCKALLDSFIVREERNVKLVDVEACVFKKNTSEWLKDPCCNPVLHWSQCCAKKTHDVKLPSCKMTKNTTDLIGECELTTTGKSAAHSKCLASGGYQKATEAAKAYGATITANASPAIGTGCDAEVAALGVRGDIYDKAIGFAAKCVRSISQGLTKSGNWECQQGLNECYTVCEDQNEGSAHANSGEGKGYYQCRRAEGAAMVEPLFDCFMEESDDDMWAQIAAISKFASKEVARDKEYTKVVSDTFSCDFTTYPTWDDQVKRNLTNDEYRHCAIELFKKKVTHENCEGRDAERGWCAVGNLTKDECNALAVSQGWRETSVDWIDGPAGTGWCKLRNYWRDNLAQYTDKEATRRCDQFVSTLEACVDFDAKDETSYVNPKKKGGTCSYGETYYNENRNFSDKANCEVHGKCHGNGHNDWNGKTKQGDCKGQFTPNRWNDCNGPNKRWKSYAKGEFHRLVGRMVHNYHGNGNPIWQPGNKDKCLGLKACNWDPWNSHTKSKDDCPNKFGGKGADTSKNYYCAVKSWGTMTEDGTTMQTCIVGGSGWSRVQSYYRRPISTEEECVKSGQTRMTAPTWEKAGISNRIWGVKCVRRDGSTNTLATCMPATVCPKIHAPTPGDWDIKYTSECNNPVCYTTETKENCGKTDSGGKWNQKWASGSGLCLYEGVSKTDCEKKTSATYWEGRTWVDGKFDSKQSCEEGECMDGSSPVSGVCKLKNLPDKICTERCKRCVPDDARWQPLAVEFAQKKQALCVNESLDEKTCQSTKGFGWNFETKLCDYSAFYEGTRTRTSCPSPSTFFSCEDGEKTSCKSGCVIKGATSWRACRDTGHQNYYDYQSRQCYARSWGNKTGTRYNFKDPHHPTAEECRVHVMNGQSPTDVKMKLSRALKCRWNNWARCLDKTSCLSAGTCTDWAFHGGKCVKAPMPDKNGYSKNCDKFNPPMYQLWGGFGCYHRNANDEASCVAIEENCKKNNSNDLSQCGFVWKTQAVDKATCEDEERCVSRNEGFMAYGGHKTQTSCESTLCNKENMAKTHKWKKLAVWKNGDWVDYAKKPVKGTWQARGLASKFSWKKDALNFDALMEVPMKAASNVYDKMYAKQITCKLGKTVRAIKTISHYCGQQTPSTGSGTSQTGSGTQQTGSGTAQTGSGTAQTGSGTAETGSGGVAKPVTKEEEVAMTTVIDNMAFVPCDKMPNNESKTSTVSVSCNTVGSSCQRPPSKHKLKVKFGITKDLPMLMVVPEASQDNFTRGEHLLVPGKTLFLSDGTEIGTAKAGSLGVKCSGATCLSAFGINLEGGSKVNVAASSEIYFESMMCATSTVTVENTVNNVASRRRLRNLSSAGLAKCLAYATVKDSKGNCIGQLLSTESSMVAQKGAQLCYAATVSETERCDMFTNILVAGVNKNGDVTNVLSSLNVKITKDGGVTKYCVDSSSLKEGSFYTLVSTLKSSAIDQGISPGDVQKEIDKIKPSTPSLESEKNKEQYKITTAVQVTYTETYDKMKETDGTYKKLCSDMSVSLFAQGITLLGGADGCKFSSGSLNVDFDVTFTAKKEDVSTINNKYIEDKVTGTLNASKVNGKTASTKVTGAVSKQPIVTNDFASAASKICTSTIVLVLSFLATMQLF